MRRSRFADVIHRYATGPTWKQIAAAIVGIPTFWLFIILFAWGFVSLDWVAGTGDIIPRSVGLVGGGIIFSLGFGLIVWTLIFFWGTRGTPFPANPPKSLITKGPYACSRNPMLGGFMIALFGIGLLFQSVMLCIPGVLLFSLLAWWFVTHVEEPEIEMRFGEEYRAYKKRVPRFLPRRKAFSQK